MQSTQICPFIFLIVTGCTPANNSHVDMVKYLMNINYSFLIQMNITNFIY